MKIKTDQSGYAEAVFWGTDEDLDAFAQYKIKPEYRRYFSKYRNDENFGHSALRIVLPKTEEIENRIDKMRYAGLHVREIPAFISNEAKEVSDMYEVYFTWWPKDSFSNPLKTMAKMNDRTLERDMNSETPEDVDGTAYKPLNLHETSFYVKKQFEDSDKTLAELPNAENITDLDAMWKLAQSTIKFLQVTNKFEDTSEEIENLKTLIKKMKKEQEQDPGVQQELMKQAKEAISKAQKYENSYIKNRDAAISSAEQSIQQATTQMERHQRNQDILFEISDLLTGDSIANHTELVSKISEYNQTVMLINKHRKQDPCKPIAGTNDKSVKDLKQEIDERKKENQLELLVLDAHIFSPEPVKLLNREISDIRAQWKEPKKELEAKITKLKHEINKVDDDINNLKEEIRKLLKQMIESTSDEDTKHCKEAITGKRKEVTDKKQSKEEKNEQIAKYSKTIEEKNTLITAKLEKRRQILGTYSGKRPDHTININFASEENPHGLDPIAMIDKAIELHQTKNYNFVGVNCARSVRIILEAGGPDKNELPSFLKRRPLIDTPQSAKHYAMFLKAHLEKQSPQMAVGTVEYYQMMMEFKLNQCKPDAANRVFLEQCKQTIDAVAQLQTENWLDENSAKEIAEATFNVAASPIYNLAAFDTVMNKYEPKNSLLRDVLQKTKDRVSELIIKILPTDLTELLFRTEEKANKQKALSEFKGTLFGTKEQMIKLREKEDASIEKENIFKSCQGSR